MRSRSAPIISRSWRCRNRLLSHSLPQLAGATTISSHWPFKRGQRHGVAVHVLRGHLVERRQRALRLDQRGVVGAAVRADHVVGEVRRDHRQRAGEQDHQHRDAAAPALRGGVVAHRRGRAVQREGQGFRAGGLRVVGRRRFHRGAGSSTRASRGESESGGGAAARADELQPHPQAQERDAHREPLHGVAVVGGDADAAGLAGQSRRRPSLALSAVASSTTVSGRKRQAGFGLERRPARDSAAPGRRRRGRCRSSATARAPTWPSDLHRPGGHRARPAPSSDRRRRARTQPRCTITALPSGRRSGVIT